MVVLQKTLALHRHHNAFATKATTSTDHLAQTAWVVLQKTLALLRLQIVSATVGIFLSTKEFAALCVQEMITLTARVTLGSTKIVLMLAQNADKANLLLWDQ